MRVLFLTLYPDTAASPRYRVTQFVPYLEAQGVACTVASAVSEATYAKRSLRRPLWYHLEEMRRRSRHIVSARDYDLVVVQKALTSMCAKHTFKRFRERISRFVYDIDDAVHVAPPVTLPTRWAWLAEPEQIASLMRDARIVLAGNEWLARETHLAGGRPEVFPTVVDTDRFRPAQEMDDVFRVGWIGSPSTAPSLGVAAEALTEVELQVMGGGDACTIPAAHHHTWSIDTEVAFIQGLSVGLMPLLESDWTRGKCALKALQYMSCGVPCVATPFGAVADIIDDGVNGVFANSPGEWRGAIERLRDPALRASLGAAARATVEARYSLRYAAPRMKMLLDQTMEHGA